MTFKHKLPKIYHQNVVKLSLRLLNNGNASTSHTWKTRRFIQFSSFMKNLNGTHVSEKSPRSIYCGEISFSACYNIFQDVVSAESLMYKNNKARLPVPRAAGNEDLLSIDTSTILRECLRDLFIRSLFTLLWPGTQR